MGNLFEKNCLVLEKVGLPSLKINIDFKGGLPNFKNENEASGFMGVFPTIFPSCIWPITVFSLLGKK